MRTPHCSPDWNGGGQATPFSMSVDREGQAWVLYTSGEIFKVSIEDASCADSGWYASVALQFTQRLLSKYRVWRQLSQVKSFMARPWYSSAAASSGKGR